MLVLTFTTIVVVANGSPLQADIAAHPSWANSHTTAETQFGRHGRCNYVTCGGRRFCVQLGVSSKEYIKGNN